MDNIRKRSSLVLTFFRDFVDRIFKKKQYISNLSESTSSEISRRLIDIMDNERSHLQNFKTLYDTYYEFKEIADLRLGENDRDLLKNLFRTTFLVYHSYRTTFENLDSVGQKFIDNPTIENLTPIIQMFAEYANMINTKDFKEYKKDLAKLFTLMRTCFNEKIFIEEKNNLLKDLGLMEECLIDMIKKQNLHKSCLEDLLPNIALISPSTESDDTNASKEQDTASNASTTSKKANDSNADIWKNHYDMDYKNRGIAVVFSMERSNFDDKKEILHAFRVDVDRIEATFKKLDFEIHIYRNLKKANLESIVVGYSERDYKRDDCFVCITLAHGRANDQILCADDKTYDLKDMYNLFQKNASLGCKPKIFINNSCRGSIILKAPDFFLIFATLDDHRAFTNNYNGSLFFTTLCELLDKKGETSTLNDIILETREKNTRIDPDSISENVGTLQRNILFYPKK